MPTLKEVEKRAEAIFQKVEALQQQLRSIRNARSTFSIENGMEYCTNAEFGKILARAAQKSLSFKGNQINERIESLAQVLEKCMKKLQECEKVIGRAMREKSWSPNLEEELSENWRLFCMHFHDAATMLDVVGLDLSMLIGKPEVSTSKNNDIDSHSVSTATDNTWHSKGSFIRLFQSRNQHKRNKLSKQQTGSSSQPQVPRLSVPNPPDNSDAVSDPGILPTTVIDKDTKYTNPSVRSDSPPPRYSDAGFSSNAKVDLPNVNSDVKPVQPAQDHQNPLSRFSTRFDAVPPPIQQQPGSHTFIAEHIHMYHGCPPPPTQQYPGGIGGGGGIWQQTPPPLPPRAPPPPLLVPPQPPPLPPLSYKSSAFSLRETLATEFLDLIKPDATCAHGIRHHKSHTSCRWGCCWQRGCFGRY